MKVVPFYSQSFNSDLQSNSIYKTVTSCPSFYAPAGRWQPSRAPSPSVYSPARQSHPHLIDLIEVPI